MNNPKQASNTANNPNQGNQGGGEPKRKENLNGYSIDQSKYRPNIEEIRSKNLNTSEMLAATVNNIIHPEDSIIYYPKNIHLLGSKYPVYPLRLKEEILTTFELDTLFFIFFGQPDRVAKEMARKEIIKRGWMYNSNYKTFFKLKGEPKTSNEEYIEGDFDTFEYEKEWKIKSLNNFKFLLK